MLLDTGKVNIDVKNKNGQTSLHKAAQAGADTVVRMLLGTGQVDGHTPLLGAAIEGKTAIVKMLLDTGKADPEGVLSVVGHLYHGLLGEGMMR